MALSSNHLFNYRPANHRPALSPIGIAILTVASVAPSHAAEPRRFQHVASKSIVKSVAVMEGTNMSATVSPDHKTILIDLQETLWSIPIGGGTATRVTDPMLEPARPDWSPQGDLIAFQGYKGGTFHIWLMKPDGTGVRRLTSGHGDDREPRFSPDGKTIAFSSDRAFEGSYDIWVVDIATGRLTRKTSAPEEEFEPTWSPDGKRIAFVSGMGVTRGHATSVNATEIKTVDDAGHIATAYSLANPAPDAHLDSPAFSPDGKALAYTQFSQGRSELMVDGKKVGAADDVFPFYPHWLPGNKVLYTGDGKILITDIASNQSTAVPFSATFQINRPGYRHRIYDFETTAASPVKGILHPSLSPDGKQIVFTALNQLWLMPIGGKPQALTSDNFYKQNPSWSPDGKNIVYTADNTGAECLYIMNLADKTTRRVTGQSTSAEIEPAWSPDGKSIAYHDQEGATLVVDIATGESREVAKSVFSPSEPSWLASSDVLAFSTLTAYSKRYREGTNRIQTLDLKTGKTTITEPAPFGTIRTRSYNGPIYSPDGSQMAFVMDSFIFTRPVDVRGIPSGPARQATHETSDSPSWSGDSKHLLYLSNGALKLLSLAGPAKAQTIPLDLTWHQSIPAGRIIIHAGTLWDGLGPDTEEDVDITIAGNRIQSIAPHLRDPRNLAPGDRFIDASGKTVMPGFWETHTHNYGGIAEAGDTSGRLWLAYGFTTLQSQGDEAYTQSEVRESFAANLRVGPRYFGATELYTGERLFYPLDHSIRSEAQLQSEFVRGQAFDADNYKTYATLSHAYQKEVTDLAHNRAGVWLASHYGPPSLLFGVDGMSHVSATSRWGYTYTRSAAGLSYSDVTTLFPAANMWVISTAFSSTTLFTDDPNAANDPRLAALDVPWDRKTMLQTRDRVLSTKQTQAALGLQREDETVAKLYHSGDLTFPGMDSSAPGAQLPLHLSLRALVKYGMKPWEALQTVTILPARAFGYEKDLGSVEAGKLADVVIIQGNPLEDIRDAVQVSSVIVNGRFYTIDDLTAPFLKH